MSLKRLERLEELVLDENGALLVKNVPGESEPAPATQETSEAILNALVGIKGVLDEINAKTPALVDGRVPVVQPTDPA